MTYDRCQFIKEKGSFHQFSKLGRASQLITWKRDCCACSYPVTSVITSAPLNAEGVKRCLRLASLGLSGVQASSLPRAKFFAPFHLACLSTPLAYVSSIVDNARLHVFRCIYPRQAKRCDERLTPFTVISSFSGPDIPPNHRPCFHAQMLLEIPLEISAQIWQRAERDVDQKKSSLLDRKCQAVGLIPVFQIIDALTPLCSSQ